MDRIYLSNSFANNFTFKQTPTTFKVTENINIKLQKRGDYKLLKVTKVSTSTIELIEFLSKILKIKESEIGYAGLKDKHATTIQYLTVPKWVSLKKFKNSDKITLEELGYCSKKLKIGNLKNNSFEIVLEDVNKDSFYKIEKSFNNISKLGFANFFGYQRFGLLEDTLNKGKKINSFGKRVKRQRSKIILAAYQSKLFNNWLNKRLEISKEIMEGKNVFFKKLSPTLLDILKNSSIPFKLLPGDLVYYYKKGKKEFFTINRVEKFLKEFEDKKLYSTGVLYGNSVRLSSMLAGSIEREFIDYDFNALKGTRRAAWIWPFNTNISHNEKESKAVLNFTLPPGAYATVLIEELLNQPFAPKNININSN